jgi:hypothetical protein
MASQNDTGFLFVRSPPRPASLAEIARQWSLSYGLLWSINSPEILKVREGRLLCDSDSLYIRHIYRPAIQFKTRLTLNHLLAPEEPKMSSFTAPSFYLSPSKAALQLQYVGKDLREIPTPAAVLDLAPFRRNCKAMLEATKALGLGFRAHVKTHKVCMPPRNHQL